MSGVDVSMYNCDSSALKNLPLDSDFSDNFQSAQQAQKGGARRKRNRTRSQRRTRAYRRSRANRRTQRRSRANRRTQRRRRQRGGGAGYFLDISAERLGGLAKVTGYNSQPELVNGEMVKSAMDEKMCGGGKKRVNHLRSNTTGRRNKQVRRRNGRKSLKGRVFYRKVGGGEKDSVYTDDMSQREFGCRQPKWEPKCI